MSQESWSEGLTFVDDLNTISEGVRNGDWLNVTLGSVGVAGAVLDPVGALIENGVGFLIEHLNPLKEWLQELTGNPGEVEGLAAAWDKVYTDLNTSGGDIVTMIMSDLGEFEGDIFDAYRHVQQNNVALLDSIAVTASSIGSGLRSAAEIVQMVYELTRDAISMIVGTILGSLLTAWIPVYGQAKLVVKVVEVVGEWVPLVRRSIDAIITAFGKLQKLLGDLGSALRSLPKVLADATGLGRYGDEVVDVITDVAKKGDEAIDATEAAADATKLSDRAAEAGNEFLGGRTNDIPYWTETGNPDDPIKFISPLEVEDAPTSRPSWRRTETDTGEVLGDLYDDQLSYIDGELAGWGDKGSVRPDWARPLDPDASMRVPDADGNYPPIHAIENKNYSIHTPDGQRSVVNKLVEQFQERITGLPAGSIQTGVVETRHIDVDADVLNKIIEGVTKGTDGQMELFFLRNRR